jgi:hypothetical protein
MGRKDVIHNLIDAIAFEVLEFIKVEERNFEDGWVPATEIKGKLELNFVAVPKSNEQYGEKGWLFAISARLLEDKGLIEFKKESSRSFYKSSKI